MKSLRAQNSAMGAKIIWHIVDTNPGWAQKALWRKYFSGPRKHCLDNPRPVSYTQLEKICFTSAPLIQQHAFQVPGNGKSIDLWHDRIMMNQPLAEVSSLQPLHFWMSNTGLNSLWDLSRWSKNSWIGWINIQVPPNLKNLWEVLLSLLHDRAPIRCNR